MKVLAPLISGQEGTEGYVEAITSKVDKIILLQIIDRDFMNKTSTAMGEVMQFSTMMELLRQKIGSKRKKCEEITEWGHTVQKILSLAILQQVDKVVLVEQNNQFFKDMLGELKKNKVIVELVKIKNEEKKTKRQNNKKSVRAWQRK